MADMQTIQWFPGHMTKTKRQIQASLKLVDAVAEIIDHEGGREGIDKADRKTVEEIKEAMLDKFDEYDRKLGRLSKNAKIAIGVSLGLSLADTIILLKILKKIH